VPVRENEVTVAVGLVPFPRIEHLIDDYGAPLPKTLELLLRRPLIERRTERSKVRGWFSLWIWILSPLTSKLMLAANSTPGPKRHLIPIDLVSTRVERFGDSYICVSASAWVVGSKVTASGWPPTQIEAPSSSAVMITAA
jgi:hypothetical protein